MDIVLKEQVGKIVYLTLNRPEKKNALNSELIDTLKSSFTSLLNDDSTRVIVMRANGNSFCSGADLGYLQLLHNNTFEENLADSSSLADLFRLIYTHPKLIISQVEGPALAGGCGLATVCDFCYATPESKFGYTEVKIGFIPAIVSYFILRKAGETRARELLLSGKIVDAETAFRYGLITGIYDKKNIAEMVSETAVRLAHETSPESVARTKNLISGIQHLNLNDAMNYAAIENAKARATEDCKKGIRAFLNKEKIKW